MAFSVRTCILTSLVLAFSSLVTSSTGSLNPGVTDGVIFDICSGNGDPNFCMRVLKSDPRTATADLRGLVKISVDLALANAKQTQSMVALSLKRAKDGRSKKLYSACLNDYGLAIEDLVMAGKYLEKGYLSFVSDSGYSAGMMAKFCSEGFAAAAPIQLANRNQQLRHFSDMITVIIKRVVARN